jgi:hypothetical protein
MLQRITRAFGDIDAKYELLSLHLPKFFAPTSFVCSSWKLQDTLVDLSVDFDFLLISALFSELWYRGVWYVCPDDNSTRFNGCGCTSRFILFDPLRCEEGLRVLSSGRERSIFVDMDMCYTRVLHIKVAYRVPHKWRHAFYVTRPLLCPRITCYVTVIKHGRCYARA